MHSRKANCPYNLADNRADFTHQVGNDRVPPLPAGGARLSDFPEGLRVTFDRTLVIDDVARTAGLSDTDRQNIGALGLRAMVAATLRQGANTPHWAIVAVSAVLRLWTPGEVALLEEATERTWAAMQRARAEAALRASEQRLRLITDAVPALIAYIDAGLQYRFVNQHYQDWFGRAPEAILGQHLRAFLGEAAFERLRPYAEAALAGRRQSFEAEVPFRQGGTRYVRSEFVPEVRPDGSVAGYYSLVIDITAHKRTEEALRASEARLQATNQQLTRTNVDLDNFIYTASHDLKAPITNIEGLLQVLVGDLPAASQLPGEWAAVLALMADSVERFKRTLVQLSDVVKLQQAHDQPLILVPLASVVEDVRRDLQFLIAGTGAQVEVDVAGCPRVRFAEKNLRSVVYNLLSNALKYRHPDRTPHVRLSCQQTEHGPVLAVQDNGLGLSPTQQQQVFTMFRRLHNHVEGSGLGLYMVKRMVENAGGRVELRSQLGVGSTFSVSFHP